MASVDRKWVTRRSLLVAGLLFAPATALWGQLPQGAAPPVELEPPPGVAEEPFTFARDGLTLNGTIATPRSVSKAVPVVVIVAGSGPTDRNANGPLLNTNAYALLAWGLAEQGVASLRYDKRGIGMSAGEGGDPTTLTTDHYVADVAAAATAVASDSRFSKVILLGPAKAAAHVCRPRTRAGPRP